MGEALSRAGNNKKPHPTLGHTQTSFSFGIRVPQGFKERENRFLFLFLFFILCVCIVLEYVFCVFFNNKNI